ncbi:MAG: hypothetical protein LBP85_04920 [Prevotellaceae bacterium]|jgi:hypothetical protein|nr:hypothetical protein [Prevotellaceae bacterium]
MAVWQPAYAKDIITNNSNIATYGRNGFLRKKENNETPVKLRGTGWEFAGIVDVETDEMRELDLIDIEYTRCRYLYFDTDTTAYGCISASEIYLHLSPQQVYVVIKDENDSYTDDIQLFYDTIKTITSYKVTKLNDLLSELKLYCNAEKNYLLYTALIHYN